MEEMRNVPSNLFCETVSDHPEDREDTHPPEAVKQEHPEFSRRQHATETA